MDCKERCSGHCNNNEQCHKINGVCPNGCQDGDIGTQCNRCKSINSTLNALGAMIREVSFIFSY